MFNNVFDHQGRRLLEIYLGGQVSDLPEEKSSVSSAENPDDITLTEGGTNDIQSKLSSSSTQSSFCDIHSSTGSMLSNDMGSTDSLPLFSPILQHNVQKGNGTYSLFPHSENQLKSTKINKGRLFLLTFA